MGILPLQVVIPLLKIDNANGATSLDDENVLKFCIFFIDVCLISEYELPSTNYFKETNIFEVSTNFFCNKFEKFFCTVCNRKESVYGI